MAPSRRNGKAKLKDSLARGRPPLGRPQTATLSSKATRTLIRSHHNLEKERLKAVAAGDDSKAQEIEQKIALNGGLSSYQTASSLGQSGARGGDSSKVLVDWLKPAFDEATRNDTKLRMLEIGALSTQNACSRVGCLGVRRIDLRSQEAGIEQVDFMELASPTTFQDRFDIISLSLVLNFVPDARARGEMLKRISLFLRHSGLSGSTESLPCLFFVLPLPCVSNSRYLTQSRLQEILGSLGFILLQSKTTSKLYYSLWKFLHTHKPAAKAFKKDELRPGHKRNNFAILLC